MSPPKTRNERRGSDGDGASSWSRSTSPLRPFCCETSGLFGSPSGTPKHCKRSNLRDVFQAFFRPPAVPASLALLALCEALEGKGRDTREFSIGGQLLPRGSEHNSTGDGMARAPVEAAAAAAAAVAQASATSDETAASGPRTGHVQHACRLLEQYLDNTSRGVHLLAVAVAEFAQSTDAAVINVEEFATEVVTGEGGGGERGSQVLSQQRSCYAWR